MKKTILLSTISSTLLIATNGDNVISLGAESRAMGGTGIAMDMGTDSVFRNPSWLADIKGTEAMFGGTLFMPNVTAKNRNANGESADSKADMSLIPEVSHAGRINENLAYGVGMFGVSGMGVDYRNENRYKGLASMRTSFQFLRFVPSLAYKKDNLRVGAGVTLAYGTLDMSAIIPSNQNDPSTAQQRGGGISDTFGFGLQMGVGYSITPEVRTGLYYQTKVDTTYDNVMDFDMDGTYDDLKLSQPAEYGVGFGYEKDGLKATVDYRKILWSTADGYDSFGWKDQSIYALGLAYSIDKLTLRGGYNYAKSPLDGVKFKDMNSAFFNIMGFPAISNEHITAGFGYEFSDMIGIDMAYVYSPKETKESMNMEATNEQNSISVALKYKFD
jgi:long-chain fatty acid transport protein